MVISAYDPNDEFWDDAEFIFADKKHRASLAVIARKVAGKGRSREKAYLQIEPFFDDFYINHNRDTDKKGNELFTEIVKDVQHNDTKWPIAPILSWLSVYHPAAARECYKACGLSKAFGIDFRVYIGVPGERGAERKRAPTTRMSQAQPVDKVRMPEKLDRQKSASAKKEFYRAIDRDAQLIANTAGVAEELIDMAFRLAKDLNLPKPVWRQKIDHKSRKYGFGGFKAQLKDPRKKAKNLLSLGARKEERLTRQKAKI